MLVFIDESGDSGVNSPNEVFVLGAVTFATKQAARETDEAIRALKNEGAVPDHAYLCLTFGLFDRVYRM